MERVWDYPYVSSENYQNHPLCPGQPLRLCSGHCAHGDCPPLLTAHPNPTCTQGPALPTSPGIPAGVSCAANRLSFSEAPSGLRRRQSSQYALGAAGYRQKPHSPHSSVGPEGAFPQGRPVGARELRPEQELERVSTEKVAGWKKRDTQIGLCGKSRISTDQRSLKHGKCPIAGTRDDLGGSQFGSLTPNVPARRAQTPGSASSRPPSSWLELRKGGPFSLGVFLIDFQGYCLHTA